VALIIAHPGHELRVHHWLEKTRPLVFVLTDGSGRTAQSRLHSTTRILERAGATPVLSAPRAGAPDWAVHALALLRDLRRVSATA